MENIRLAFLPGEQIRFLHQISQKSGLQDKELVKIIEIHARTFLDWKREKYHMSLSAARTFSKMFAIDLPEKEAVLVARWRSIKRAASVKGGKALIEKYGNFATDEGRRKGGKISWIKRKGNKELWEKYAHVITRPKESIELAELMGILLGDGGLTHFQCSIYLSSETDIDFSQYVKRLCENLFHITPIIYGSKRAKVLQVSISSVDLVEYLMEKGLSLGNKVKLQVGVPEWILTDTEYIKACIRGLIDTDGCFIIHKYSVNRKAYQYEKMIFSNKSMPLLRFMYDNLKRFGFSPRMYANKHVWLLNHTEVRRYLREIGTNNYKPTIKLILESGPDGKAQVC